MIDLYLHAQSEAALAAALPMLRGKDLDGNPVWLTSSPWHALDPGFIVVTTPAVFGKDMKVLTEAVIEPGYHANLRLLDGHPSYAAIIEATKPFVVQPATPQRMFAGGPIVAPVPEVISDRQFAQVLALRGVVSQDEALGWAARGDLPSALNDALNHVPEAGNQRFAARMMLASATTYERHHPLVPVLGALLTNPATEQPYDAPALDNLWRAAAAL